MVKSNLFHYLHDSISLNSVEERGSYQVALLTWQIMKDIGIQIFMTLGSHLINTLRKSE